MKKNLTILFALVVIVAMASNVMAQQSAELPKAYMEKMIPGAQLGMVMCQNASGNTVACSGNIEETILGIVTNVPYVTVNKPANPNGSKFIFEALVSSSNGALSKGDFLVAGKEGRLVLSNDANQAYAVLLDDIAIDGKARVKVLQDKSK